MYIRPPSSSSSSSSSSPSNYILELRERMLDPEWLKEQAINQLSLSLADQQLQANSILEKSRLLLLNPNPASGDR